MRISDWSSDVCSSDLCFGNVGSRGQKAAILSLAVANAAPVEAEYREAIACKPCSQLRHAPVRARPQFVAARYDEQAGIHPPFIDAGGEPVATAGKIQMPPHLCTHAAMSAAICWASQWSSSGSF